MSDREQPNTPEQYRLAGEDTPAWLALGFALAGMLLVAAVTWMWLGGQPRLQEQQSRSDTIQERTAGAATEPAASPAIKPIPSPVETPRAVVVEKEQAAVLSEPSHPLGVPAAPLATPTDAGENTTGEQTASISTQLLAKRKDCPPAITIRFQPGRAKPVITDETRIRLEKLRAWLDGHPEVKLAVEGHADSEGPERYNLLLSYRRTKVVAALLNNAGLPETRITLFAVGENDPLPGLPANSEDNRRVFLYVKGIESCQEATTDRER